MVGSRELVSSFAGMTSPHPVSRKRDVVQLSLQGRVGLEPESTLRTPHLLYAESVFGALSGPVANQVGAVVSV